MPKYPYVCNGNFELILLFLGILHVPENILNPRHNCETANYHGKKNLGQFD